MSAALSLFDEPVSVPVFRVKMVRESNHETDPRIRSPRDAARIFWEYADGPDREILVILLLDTKHHVVGIHTVSVGDLTSSIVHPREVFKAAILANAACFVLCHNHPSGDPAPSPEDVAVARRIAEAGELLGIEQSDFLTVGSADRWVSLKERGFF